MPDPGSKRWIQHVRIEREIDRPRGLQFFVSGQRRHLHYGIKKQAIGAAVVPPVEVPVVAAPAAVQPVEAPVVAPETTGSKKRKKDAALEQVLEAKAS